MYHRIVLVTGARDWSDRALIKETLLPYQDTKVLLIHGGCVGADLIAASVALELNFSVLEKVAQWHRYGRGAGPVRNQEMVNIALEYAQQGIEVSVIAFHDHLVNSRGTKDCVGKAEKVGLVVKIVSH